MTEQPYTSLQRFLRRYGRSYGVRTPNIRRCLVRDDCLDALLGLVGQYDEAGPPMAVPALLLGLRDWGHSHQPDRGAHPGFFGFRRRFFSGEPALRRSASMGLRAGGGRRLQYRELVTRSVNIDRRAGGGFSDRHR